MKYHYHGMSLIKHPPEFADDHVICSRISNGPILSFSTNFQMQIDHQRLALQCSKTPFVDPVFSPAISVQFFVVFKNTGPSPVALGRP